MSTIGGKLFSDSWEVRYCIASAIMDNEVITLKLAHTLFQNRKNLQQAPWAKRSIPCITLA